MSVEELARAGPRRRSSPGVGKTIAEKIDALLETGSIPAADKLKAAHPAGPGRGHAHPRARAEAARKLLYDELGRRRRSTSCARRPSRGGCKDVPGLRRRRPRRTCSRRSPPAPTAAPRRACCCRRRCAVGEELVDGAARAPGGDPRRARGQRAAHGRHRARTSTSSPPSSDPAALVEALRRAATPIDVGRTPRARPARKAMTHTGLPVDLRIVPEEAFGNLLQHFTGSGRHNEALRTDGGQARPARERVRHRRRRDRRPRTRARPRRRSTSGSACSTSRRSCARTAASSRRRARASCRS